MDNHIILNQEIAPKPMQSISGEESRKQAISFQSAEKINTLDEPIIETVKRDLTIIAMKIRVILKGEGYENIRRHWDLWGPLLITLLTASLCAFHTNGSIKATFTTVFMGMWLGPLALSLNLHLLGARTPILQTLCLIIYFSAPITLYTLAIFIIGIFFRSFLVNLAVSILALVFTMQCSVTFYKNTTPDRVSLSVVPAAMYYAFMCIFIAMTQYFLTICLSGISHSRKIT